MNQLANAFEVVRERKFPATYTEDRYTLRDGPKLLVFVRGMASYACHVYVDGLLSEIIDSCIPSDSCDAIAVANFVCYTYTMSHEETLASGYFALYFNCRIGRTYERPNV